MEIGVVVHGPGIIDSGWAVKIIDILSNYGNVHCRLGGTMGRTAVIDAALEDIIDISLKLLPSQSLELFNRENVDIIFLLNYGKSPETGRVFGYKVFNHYFKQISNEDYLATNHKPLYESSIPVIQIERPGEDDGSIISWNTELNEQLSKSRRSKRFKLGFGKKNMLESLSFNFEELFDNLKSSLNLVEVTPEEVVSSYLSNNQERQDEDDIERILRSYEDYETSNYTYRKIHGVSPDENIFINGIVVGYSNADSIVLVARDGLIVDIINGTIKFHGLDKLGPVDLERVIVKTGLLRKAADVNPRVLAHDTISIKDTERNIYSGEISEDEYSFKVAYVDHAAYDIYKFKDFDLVVTIGDDTSLVASDILYRFDIPIIGITDGDLDKVVENGFVNEKSTIVEVAPGFDDIVGHHIHEKLFLSKDTLEIPFDEESDSVESFKSIMFNVFKSYVLENIKEVVPSFLEKDYGYNVVNSYERLDETVGSDNLDEFIDELEYEGDEGSNEFYLDEDGESAVDELYMSPDIDGPVDEIFVEHDLDGPVDEIFVEHDLDGSVDGIFVEHDLDGPVEEIYVEESLDEDIIYEDAPIEEVYIEEAIDDVIFIEDEDDLPVDVEEIVSNELETFEEELINKGISIIESEDSVAFEEELDGSDDELDASEEELNMFEEELLESDEDLLAFDEEFSESEEEFSESEEEFSESDEELDSSDGELDSSDDELDSSDEELDSSDDELDSSDDELDDSDGWGEYIEEEFGESNKDSQGSD